jgi:predicted transcriptional regulator
MGAVKDEAKKLIDSLPEHASWDDIMYEFYVKKKLAKALDEAARGEVVPHEEAKKQILSK